jgi:hypothetical protein
MQEKKRTLISDLLDADNAAPAIAQDDFAELIG